ncbi:MAG: hypothetical protein A4E30_00312 [Methanomassiliicoccales archaeon PtaB.Bin215]|nr:MAG: hypothetical protein A4E30_00312 [Methanomassiliicoccales archaeon PtaB.Bin215]
MAAALPGAVAEVKALTRDLPVTKMCKVMASAEEQYEKWKDKDPQIAGGYLDQMRKCAIELAKWLGVDKGFEQKDNHITFTVRWNKGISEPADNVNPPRANVTELGENV